MIQAVLDYTLAIWKIRNGVIHGHDSQQARVIAVDALKECITTAYEEYSKDPHIIPASWRHIFHRPLATLIHSDKDFLSCWVCLWTKATLQANPPPQTNLKPTLQIRD